MCVHGEVYLPLVLIQDSARLPPPPPPLCAVPSPGFKIRSNAFDHPHVECRILSSPRRVIYIAQCCLELIKTNKLANFHYLREPKR